MESYGAALVSVNNAQKTLTSNEAILMPHKPIGLSVVPET